jgi:cell division control protein 24
MTLIEKLFSFPLFEYYLFPDGVEIYQRQDAPLIDPVAVLWNCFRLGAPLCMIYNQLNPRAPLKVSDVSSVRPPDYKKVCKDNVYHFILACKKELQLKEADFSISELYKDDTHGFMKVSFECVSLFFFFCLFVDPFMYEYK